MAWTAPRTWVAGELVTAALMNTHLRDNLLDLDLKRSTFSGQVRYTGIISPTALAADTNNWNPTGLATCNWIRLTSSTSVNLTGIVAQPDGTEILITNANTGASGCTLKNQDGGSSSVNRFANPGALDVGLDPGDSVRAIYDATTQRWRTYGD